jgi:hypothetical protein
MKSNSELASQLSHNALLEKGVRVRNARQRLHAQHPFRFLKTHVIKHVSRFCLLDMDRAMKAAGIEPALNPQGRIETFGSKVLARLHATRNFRRSSQGPVFVACMGPSESRILPFAYWTEIIPYCFDCWEPEYEAWRAFFLRHRIRLAFFSARQSAQYFANILPSMTSVWVPEATDPAEYEPQRRLAERDIDVLELGRKHDSFHFRIAPSMTAANKVHLFEEVKGEVLFGNRLSLANGLGRSKISICFPCSLTHVERSGTVETVTHRYFESMASKCILFGHCPSELLALFGYNPIIEAEAGREAEQIESMFSNLDFYQELIDRNYERLLQVGTWQSRIPIMVQAIGRLFTRRASDMFLENRR